MRRMQENQRQGGGEINSDSIIYTPIEIEVLLFRKQGRIHGYPSCVRVGSGHIGGHLIIWAGAVRPKTAKAQKLKYDKRIGGRTNRGTKWGVELHSTCLETTSQFPPFYPLFPPSPCL